MMVITYQTFVVRTPRYTILVDTCTARQGSSAAVRFSRQGALAQRAVCARIAYDRWTMYSAPISISTILAEHHAARWPLGADIPECEIHFSQKRICGLEVEHARGANPPGTVFRDNCLPIVEAGQALLVDDDMRSTTPSP